MRVTRGQNLPMLNSCNFIGNLGADPEIRHTQNNTVVANFRIAVTEKWKSDGEKQERTEWVSVVCFGKLAEIVETYLRKGAKIYLSGRMQTRKWQDKDGNDRYSTEIVAREMIMLGEKNKQESSQAARSVQESENPEPDFDDSSIPF